MMCTVRWMTPLTSANTKGIIISRPVRPIKEIDAAVQYAIARSWRVAPATGHAWARVLCPHAERDGCRLSVWSTPRVAENHARQIRRYVDECPH